MAVFLWDGNGAHVIPRAVPIDFFFFLRTIDISRVVFLPAPKWPSTYAVTLCADKSLLQTANTKYIIMSHRSSGMSENRQTAKKKISIPYHNDVIKITDFHRLGSL